MLSRASILVVGLAPFLISPVLANDPPAGPNTPPLELCDGKTDPKTIALTPSDRYAAETELAELCKYAQMPKDPVHDTADKDPEATHKHWTYSARFSPDGKWIASASLDKTVKLWDVATGKLIRTVATTQDFQWDKRSMTGRFRDVVFLSDGKRVAVAADAEPVKVVDAANGNVVKALGERTIKSYPFALRVATSRSLLFAANDDGGVDAYDTQSLALKYKLPGPVEGTGSTRAIAVSEATNVVATAQEAITGKSRSNATRTLALWKLDSGEKIASVNLGERGTVNALSFSADGKLLAAAMDGVATVFSMPDLKPVRTIKLHEFFSVTAVALSKDGKTLMLCRGHPQAFDVETGKRTKHFGPFTDLCHSLDYSPDERFIVTTSMGSDLRLWDVKAERPFFRRFGRNVTPSY